MTCAVTSATCSFVRAVWFCSAAPWVAIYKSESHLMLCHLVMLWEAERSSGSGPHALRCLPHPSQWPSPSFPGWSCQKGRVMHPAVQFLGLREDFASTKQVFLQLEGVKRVERDPTASPTWYNLIGVPPPHPAGEQFDHPHPPHPSGLVWTLINCSDFLSCPSVCAVEVTLDAQDRWTQTSLLGAAQTCHKKGVLTAQVSKWGCNKHKGEWLSITQYNTTQNCSQTKSL